MKHLILVRHAKAMKPKEGLPDFVRSLKKKGTKQAKNISKKLKRRKIVPELYISSPANRALETAQFFARQFNYPRKKIVLKDDLYSPLSEQNFLALIKELSDSFHSVIIFGHEPTISQCVKYFAKNFQDDMPTCSAAVIGFKKESWKEIGKGLGEIIYHEYPRRLAKHYAQIQANASTDINDQIFRVLKKIDNKAAIANEKSILQWSKKVAKKFTKALREFKKKENKKTENNVTKQVGKKEQKTTTPEKTATGIAVKEQEKPKV